VRDPDLGCSADRVIAVRRYELVFTEMLVQVVVRAYSGDAPITIHEVFTDMPHPSLKVGPFIDLLTLGIIDVVVAKPTDNLSGQFSAKMVYYDVVDPCLRLV